MKKSIKKWLILFFLLYLLVILLLNTLPLNSLEQMSEEFFGEFHMDYLVHVLFFLPWILFRCVFFKKRKMLWLLIGIFFAVGIELLQYYLPYRSFNLYDLIFNVVGLLLGFAIFVGVDLKIEDTLQLEENN